MFGRLASSVLCVTLVAVGCSASGPRSAARSVAAKRVVPTSSAGPDPPSSSAAPVADAGVWRGHGELAYVHGRELHVRDSRSGRDRVIVTAGIPTAPQWSPDGTVLTYLVATATDGEPSSVLGPGEGQLWAWSPATGRARQVTSYPVSQPAWSSRGALGWVRCSSDGRACQLLSWRPRQKVNRIAAVGAVPASFTWSPDGHSVAYAGVRGTAELTRTSRLVTADADGKHPRLRYQASGSGLVTSHWWPSGRGVLFWLDPQFSSSLAADGMDLMSLPLTNSRPPRRLTSTLGYRSEVSTAPGTETVTAISADGRAAWTREHLTVCTLIDNRCTTDAANPSKSGNDTDPCVVPGSTQVLFVSGRDQGDSFGLDPAGYRAWYGTRQLWTASLTSGNRQSLPQAGRDVAAPQVSRDGHSVLYVREDALWLLNLDIPTAQPIRVSQTLYAGAVPPNYYGTTTWTDTFAWTR